MPLPNGASFAGYRIGRLLGSGGMGEVYLAQHPRLPKQVALKTLPPEWSADQEYRARFTREADLASTLWHPHIVGVHDRGEVDGQLWISMDFVDGVDASRLLSERYPAGMPVADVSTIVTAVSNALDYAHNQGLLHRDVKPANIMLTHVDGDGEQRVLLADFGIARDLNDISGLTQTNMTVGTVAYAAPEQLLGEQADGRADQYSLAATAYHLLTGSQLFPHSNPAVVISRHLNSPPPLLADNRPELAALDPVFTRALAKAPESRFERSSDFARALATASHSSGAFDPTQTAPTSPPHGATTRARATDSSVAVEPRSGQGRKYWLITAAAVAAVLVTTTLVIWRPWQSLRVAASQDAQSTLSPSQPPSAPPISPPTTSSAPAVLPDILPTNSGCRGDLVSHTDIDHRFLGPVRIFLTLAGTGLDKVGCVASVTASGKVLPAIYIRVTSHFGFPSPASDATGNTFVTYNPGRYDGVLVLVPSRDGFEDIGWESESTASSPSYWGRLAIYYAELVGPGPDGQYTIRQSSNDCDPSCADGTVTDEDLRWNGKDYVGATPSVFDPYTPSSQTVSPAPPSLSLEAACSNPEWRNANGAEGDRLCGAPNPYG